MARKEIRVEELVEVIYQWHRGSGISQIKRSLGIVLVTIKKAPKITILVPCRNRRRRSSTFKQLL